MKEHDKTFPLNNRTTIQEGLINNDELKISENNSPIWGRVINEKLKSAEGKIGEYRYMSISVEKNGRDLYLAQGIWNLTEASEIKKRFKNNKPDISDYFGNGDENNEWISFTCNKKVFKYLNNNGVFVKDKNSKDGEKYKIFYPQLLGLEDKDSLEINVYPYKSSKEDYALLFMNIITKNKQEAMAVI